MRPDSLISRPAAWSPPGAAVPTVSPDANILVALFVRGDRHPLWRWRAEGRCRVVLCPAPWTEAERMLRRAFRAGDARLAALRDRLDEPPANPPGPAPSLHLEGNPGDEVVLREAAASGADYLVTSDRRFRLQAGPVLAAAGVPLRVVSVAELERLLPPAPAGAGVGAA